MKNILVPTDFSACATYATKVAFGMASQYDATIHIYTKINIHYNWINLNEEEKKQYPEDLQKIHNTELLLNEWQRIAKEKNIKLKTAWSGGELIENITDYTDDYKIDFIIMGSHGASGKNEYFIGSNTQKVVRMVHCPVLIVKDELKTLQPKKVVFASEFDEDEKKSFQYLLDFVTPFNPEIHLIQVNTSSWFGQPYVLAKATMDDFKAMCGDLKCYTHFYRDWSIDAGIRNLSEEIGADLISISNLERRPLKRMFSGSNVEALVNHADAPVLSIDFPIKNKT
jgi:nucleotide-binding universal stress UspA family protein